MLNSIQAVAGPTARWPSSARIPSDACIDSGACLRRTALSAADVADRIARFKKQLPLVEAARRIFAASFLLARRRGIIRRRTHSPSLGTAMLSRLPRITDYGAACSDRVRAAGLAAAVTRGSGRRAGRAHRAAAACRRRGGGVAAPAAAAPGPDDALAARLDAFARGVRERPDAAGADRRQPAQPDREQREDRLLRAAD